MESRGERGEQGWRVGVSGVVQKRSPQLPVPTKLLPPASTAPTPSMQGILRFSRAQVLKGASTCKLLPFPAQVPRAMAEEVKSLKGGTAGWEVVCVCGAGGRRRTGQVCSGDLVSPIVHVLLRSGRASVPPSWACPALSVGRGIKMGEDKAASGLVACRACWGGVAAPNSGSVRTLQRVDGRLKRRILSKERSTRSDGAADSNPNPPAAFGSPVRGCPRPPRAGPVCPPGP